MARLPFIFLLILFISCQEETIPKPKGMLSLTYPAPEYRAFESGCPYSFEKNLMAKPMPKGACDLNLEYAKMNATLYLSYKPVNNNLKALLRDAQKLALDHTVRADGILDQPFVNPDGKVYGMFYSIAGNAASQSHFYVTDSTQHFLTGSLYFYAKPNYDSIYPAAVYLQKDIRRLMESIQWKH